MGDEVGGAELGPAFRYHLGARQQPLDGEREMLGRVAPIAVVGMDMGDLADLRPRLRGADGGGDAVRGLDVGEAEGVFGLRHRLVEQEVGAAIDEDGQQLQLFGNRAERRGIAARDDAGEQIDLALELHAAKLFDIGVGAGGFVGGDRLDLALAQKAALGVDLLGGENMALERGVARAPPPAR